MTEATETTTTRTPWHLWVVGGLSLAWNAYGAYDYVMSHTDREAYFRSMGMTDPQIAHYLAMPAWTHAAWAIGVWGAILGSGLLLLRRKWALHAFAASLAGLLASLVYAYGLSDGAALMGTQGMVMNVVIAAACLFFIWYARAAMRKGVLR